MWVWVSSKFFAYAKFHLKVGWKLKCWSKLAKSSNIEDESEKKKKKVKLKGGKCDFFFLYTVALLPSVGTCRSSA